MPYYLQLGNMQKEFADQFQVILYPCNQFYQEPQDPEDIIKGVADIFDDAETLGGLMLMEKTCVNDAEYQCEKANELYRWMKEHAGLEKISWTWGEMFIFDRRGEMRAVVSGMPWHAYGVIQDLVKEAPGSEMPVDEIKLDIQYAQGATGMFFTFIDWLFSNVFEMFPMMGPIRHMTTIFGRPMFNGYRGALKALKNYPEWPTCDYSVKAE